MSEPDPNVLESHVRSLLGQWEHRCWHETPAFRLAGGDDQPSQGGVPILRHHILVEPQLFQQFLDELPLQSSKDRSPADMAVQVALAILNAMTQTGPSCQLRRISAETEVSHVHFAREIADRLARSVSANRWPACAGGLTVAYLNGWEPASGRLRARSRSLLSKAARDCLKYYFAELIDGSLRTLGDQVLGFRERLAETPDLGDAPEHYFAQRLLNRFLATRDVCTCYQRVTDSAVDRDAFVAAIRTAELQGRDPKSQANKRANSYRKVVSCILNHGLASFDPAEMALPRFVERAVNGNQGKRKPLGDPNSAICKLRGEGFTSGMLYDDLCRQGFEDLRPVAIAKHECTNRDCAPRGPKTDRQDQARSPQERGKRPPVREKLLTVLPNCPKCHRYLADEEHRTLRIRGWLVLTKANDGGFEERRMWECSQEKCHNLYPQDVDRCPLCQTPHLVGQGHRPITVYCWAGHAGVRPPPEPGPQVSSGELIGQIAEFIQRRWTADDWRYGLAEVFTKHCDMLSFLIPDGKDAEDPAEIAANCENQERKLRRLYDQLQEQFTTLDKPLPPLEDFRQGLTDAWAAIEGFLREKNYDND